MKKFLLFLMFTTAVSVAQPSKNDVDRVVDGWHKAAADANFDAYFSYLTPDAIFIGTDPTENWNVEQFKAFAKPYFDRGRAWKFTAIERNVYFSADGKTAWFDELLDTWMKICRGSGVTRKGKDGWKIVHYVLSMTIPNDNIDDLIKIKHDFDDKELAKKKKN